MRNLILSAFSDEYASDTAEQAQALREFGIEYTEVRHLDGKNISVLSENEILQAKSIFEQNGIRVSAIGSPIGKVVLEGSLAEHFAMAERVFSYANLLGAKYVRIFSFYAPEGKQIGEMRDEVFSAMSRLICLSKQYNVTLCHENEANIYGDIPERCVEIHKAIPDIKSVFDPANFVQCEVDTLAAWEALSPYVDYLHIKDALKDKRVVPAGYGIGNVEKNN